MKTKFIALTFLAILLVSSVLAVTITLTDSNVRTSSLLSRSNGTDTFYYLNFSKGTTDNELISTYEPALESKTLNLSGIQLANQDLRENSVKINTNDYWVTMDTGVSQGGISIPEYYTNRGLARTYSLFVNPNSLTANDRMWDSGTGYIAYVAEGWKFDAPASNGKVMGGNLEIGNWTHLVAVVNETEWVWLYKNGQLVNETNSTSLTGGATVNATIFGRGGLGSTTFNGSVRNMIVYEQTLTPEQINAIYINNGLPSIANNITELDVSGQFQLYPNGTLLRYTASSFYVSSDYTNFNLAYNFTDNGLPVNGTSTVWLDAKNRTWISPWNSGKIYRGSADLQSFSEVLTISCDNSTTAPRLISPQGIDNGLNGDIYLGSYVLGGSNDEWCGHVYKVTDAGVGSLIYNATAEHPNQRNIPRHVHVVQCNPYSNYCYVSIGDTSNRKEVLRFDKDTGTNFVEIRRGLEDEISWQPTAFEFTENYIFIGEDLGSTDINNYGSQGASKVARFLQGDDNLENYDFVWNYDQNISGFVSFLEKDNQNRIYWTLQTVNNRSDFVIMRTDDEGNTTRVIYKLGANSYSNGAGIGLYTNIDESGTFFVAPNQLGVTSPLKISPVDTPIVRDEWKLNEGSGSIAYNSNLSMGQNGTLYGDGFSRQNNTLYKYLNRGSEFTTDKTTGIITLVNRDFMNQPANIDYEYFTWNSIYDYLKGYWSFDFGNSSMALDLSGNGNDGQLLNSASINTSCLGGYGDCAELFKESSSSINIPAGQYINLTNNNITISMWVRSDGRPIGTIFSSSSLTTGGRFVIGKADSSSGTLNIFFNNGTDSVTHSAIHNKDLSDGEWHHLAFVIKSYDGYTTIKTYADNDDKEILNSTHIGGNFYNNQVGQIGRYSSWGTWNGSIDEVMIFNYALNPEQVKAIYYSKSPRFIQAGNLSSNGSIGIETGNNTLNITSNFAKELNGSLINLAIEYYNGAWNSVASQDVNESNPNSFNISTSSSNFTYNYTLFSGDNQFYSSWLGGSLDYIEYLNVESEVIIVLDNSCISSVGSIASGLVIIFILLILIVIIAIITFLTAIGKIEANFALFIGIATVGAVIFLLILMIYVFGVLCEAL